MLGLWAPDFVAEDQKARDEIRGWLRSGSVISVVDSVTGLENAPGVLISNLEGGNIGTRILIFE
jgi:NADPH-dependent curcumin reductase CurA